MKDKKTSRKKYIKLKKPKLNIKELLEMSNLEIREKVKLLEDLSNTIGKRNEINKKTANTKIKIKSFNAGFEGDYGGYCDIAIYIDKGYEVYKKIVVCDLIESLLNGTVYVMNPCFIDRYFKQKWYRKFKGYI